MAERTFEELAGLARSLSPERLEALISTLSPELVGTLLDAIGTGEAVRSLPKTPVEQAHLLVRDFQTRPHLDYLSDRIAQALEDVNNGHDRKIIIEMPPRSGKSLLATQISAAWALSCHPSWEIMLTSYSGTLATSWGRQIRRWTSEGKLGSHLRIAKDAGAAMGWDTVDGGSITSRSMGGDITGRGAKMLVVDDPHKDFTDAHSVTSRDAVWNWWLSVANTRLNAPSLVLVIMTRWHEDDLVGRLLSKDREGDPDEWEVIRFPAIAEENDILGREIGDPLFSPLLQETREEAISRWKKVKESVGSYVWSALYQQRPAPPEGAIFNTGWWRYWTNDETLASRDFEGNLDPEGHVVYLQPDIDLAGATWLDSWDLTFKGSGNGDWVVGQRWARKGANRYLIGQQRGRWGFNDQLSRVEAWAKPESVLNTGRHVHRRIVEDAANGPALIETLRSKISGIAPIRAKGSKENRAHAVTPEIESGNVRIPLPTMPGYEWVTDYISEFRNFPNDAHDDQVDSTSQALLALRVHGNGGIVMPGETQATRALPAQGGQQRIPGIAMPGMVGGGTGAQSPRITAAHTSPRRT